MAEEVTITPLKDASYHVQGRILLTLPDGEVLETEGETWLCRCGGSSNKPFCDGTHRKIGFKADEVAARAQG